jgi:hypothetical protein
MIFGVLVKPRVVAAGAPALEGGLRGVVVDAELRGHRRQPGRQRQDRAGVEVAVRPPIEAIADTRQDRVVDGRVAERAGDADARDRSVDDGAAHADHRVQPDQRDRGGRIVEVRGREHLRRNGGRIDLEADREGRLRRQRLDQLVEPQRVGPQLLVAERVVPEDALAVGLGARRAVPGLVVVTSATGQDSRCA